MEDENPLIEPQETSIPLIDNKESQPELSLDSVGVLDTLGLESLGAETNTETEGEPQEHSNITPPAPETLVIRMGDFTLSLSSYREDIFSLANLALQLKGQFVNGGNRGTSYT